MVQSFHSSALLEGIGVFLWYTIITYVKEFQGLDALSYVVPCSPVNINSWRGRARLEAEAG
jgi:hypothetical protein